MQGLLEEVVGRLRRGETVALATVVSTWRSAPRGPGASMVVAADGTVAGSVSGGCVDGDVYEVAQDVLASGVPAFRRYGVSDELAGSVGLTCGGTIEVLVERLAGSPEVEALAEAVETGRPVARVTVVEHPDASLCGAQMVVKPGSDRALVTGTFGAARLDDAVRDDALGLIATGRTGMVTYGPEGERQGTGCRVFIEPFTSAPRLIVAGVTDFAAAVASLARFLGYRVTVCDARIVFATSARFPDADEVVVDWPHRYLAAELDGGRTDTRTVVLVLTHDPKFDVPLLQVALAAPTLGFVGAMGSRRTHDDRLKRLREVGLDDEALARLSSPVGLDLGARTPEETALSILAEVLARQWGGGGAPLGELRGPIHHGQGRRFGDDAQHGSSR